MPIITFPQTFDLQYYRTSHLEFAALNDEVLLNEHRGKYANEQGLSTCPYDCRETLQSSLQGMIDRYHIRTLEISPWYRPFISGDTVKYFGVMDSDDLKKESLGYGLPVDQIPSKIDFVSKTGDLNIVNETFDIVFSSHVIEHCPDLVQHFRQIKRILNRNGLYILIIPDKRYCFDYYHSESTFSEVIDAFVNERKFPRLADVINQGYTVTHNDAERHWLGDHGERFGYRNTPLEPDLKVKIMDEYFSDDGTGLNREQFLRLIEKYKEASERGEYISTHNWRFTPDSFGYIVNLLNELHFINLPLYRLCHTLWGRQEFIAVLENK